MTSSTARAIAGPALLLAALTLVALATRPLLPIDETRYVSVAWEMWLRNDYLVLFKNGEPYSDKPPLMFWLYNLGWAAFGVNAWWPRLVSPLASLGCLFLSLSIARRLWPLEPGAGPGTVWILGSTLLWMVFSTSAMFDVLLAFIVLTGIRGLLIAADASMPRGFAWLALAIGAGMLAKGPVVLLHLLPPALLCPFWRRGAHAHGPFWKRWYTGLALAMLAGASMALAWAIPAAIRGGEDYRHAIFWGQTANRMVDSFAHKRPFWWYLPLLPALLFPWLVWPTVWRRLAALRTGGLDDGLRFCLAWAIAPFIAFSLISGKQVHYLIPLFPAFALFTARLLCGAKPGGIGLPAALTALVAMAMVYYAFAGLPGHYAHWHGFAAWPGMVLVVLAVGLAWAARSGGSESWRLPSLALLSACLLALFLASVTRDLASRADLAPIAQRLKQKQQAAVPIAYVGRYHAQFQFVGRLEKPLDVVDEDALSGWITAHPDGVVVMVMEPEEVPADVLFHQAYRGESLVLLDAAQLRAHQHGRMHAPPDTPNTQATMAGLDRPHR